MNTKTKKTLIFSLISIIGTSGANANSLDAEREIFLSGVSNTLKVIKYQKEQSDNFTNKPPKYCLLFHFPNGIDEFDTIRLEALALAKSEKPIYFQNNRKRKELCFTTANTNEAIKTKEKYLKEKFIKTFSKYKPNIIKLKKQDGYIPLVQGIGVLFKDSSIVIQTLNDKIMTLQKQIKKKDRQMKEMTNIVSQTVKTLKTFQLSNKQNIKPIVKISDNDNITGESNSSKNVLFVE